MLSEKELERGLEIIKRILGVDFSDRPDVKYVVFKYVNHVICGQSTEMNRKFDSIRDWDFELYYIMRQGGLTDKQAHYQFELYYIMRQGGLTDKQAHYQLANGIVDKINEELKLIEEKKDEK
jgi:hypothetical protein